MIVGGRGVVDLEYCWLSCFGKFHLQDTVIGRKAGTCWTANHYSMYKTIVTRQITSGSRESVLLTELGTTSAVERGRSID